ncbi:MAG: hypothetical protein R2991_04035 [Thermoanaerobaculia bacterium]
MRSRTQVAAELLGLLVAVAVGMRSMSSGLSTVNATSASMSSGR